MDQDGVEDQGRNKREKEGLIGDKKEVKEKIKKGD